MTEQARRRHNDIAPKIVSAIATACETEGEAMVLLESVVLGVMLLHRGTCDEGKEFLDVLTMRTLERWLEILETEKRTGMR